MYRLNYPEMGGFRQMGYPCQSFRAHLRRAKSKAGPVPGAARRSKDSALAPRLISYSASGALRQALK
jgi:hypothetical protein